MGNHNRMNCRDTPRYCNEDGKPKTTEQLLAMRPKRPELQRPEPPKPSELKLNVNLEYHIGGALDGPMPDYYGETENSANVPYFPGGNQDPNTCRGAGGAACAISLFVSLIPYQSGPPNTHPNFFVSFQVNYNEASGVTMSDIYWANQYQGQAVFQRIKIGNEVILGDHVYMPTAANIALF